MKLPRFQFHLRTLFVVVTIVAVACAYVAHEARIVAERKAWVQATPDLYLYAREMSSFFPNRQYLDNAPSLIRRLLGDEPLAWAAVDPKEIGAVEALFPEAAVINKQTGGR